MGLFSKKESCCICGKEGNVQILDGVICKDCKAKSFNFYLSGQLLNYKKISKQQIMASIEKKEKDKELFSKFKATNSVTKKFYMDENNKLWYSPLENSGKKPPLMHSFSDVIDYELLEDGTSIIKGGLGSAIVGGALFGGVGALVGAAVGGKKQKEIIESMKISITLNDTLRPKT